MLPSGTQPPIFAWAIYDMAAHGYTLMIAGVAFPVYFAAVVAAGRPDVDLLWSIALGMALLSAGAAGPWLGALADGGGHRHALLIGTTLGSAAACAGLGFLGPGDVLPALLLFVVAHVLHLVATSLYNSYLPLLVAPQRLARVSGLAWGLSYLGAIACYLLCLPFTRGGLEAAHAETFRQAFVATAAFLVVIGLPTALLLPRQPRAAAAATVPARRRLRATLAEWRRDPNVPRLLFAYYLVNDGVVSVVFFTALTLRQTFGLAVQEILTLSLLVQLVAIPATVFFGWLGGRWSQRGAIYVTIVLWVAIVLLLINAEGRQGALAIVPALGIVLGSAQTLFRSLFAGIVPVDRTSEYFGFQTLFGRASAAFGPLAFGLVSVATGSQRAAMASLLVFFVAGGAMLAFVRLPDLRGDAAPGSPTR